MLEVEVKIKQPEHIDIPKYAADNGFEAGQLLWERDTYLNSPWRDFKESDEAFRVRRRENKTTGELSQVVTYKGPKLDTTSNTRTEMEVAVEDADTMQRILEAVSFTPVPMVEKLRQYYHRGNVTICHDRVTDLGDFMEIEVIAPEEDQDQALAQIEEILADMGLSLEDNLHTSYLGMLQSSK